MNRTPEYYEQESYFIIEKIDVKTGLVLFVKEHLRKMNNINLVFWLVNVLFFFLSILMIKNALSDELSGSKVVIYAFLGLFLSLMLIPVHELIHASVYKYLGAMDVRFTYDFRSFLFTAQAHRFVINRTEFYVLAIAPFVVLSLCGGVFYFVLPGYRIVTLCFLFFHTSLCSGDLGLISYFHKNRKIKLLTYDDCDRQEVYFISEVE